MKILVNGLAIGNPSAPSLANVFLFPIEDSIFNSCPIDFRLKFDRKYLDDSFVIFDSEDLVSKFFRFIIVFTVVFLSLWRN